MRESNPGWPGANGHATQGVGPHGSGLHGHGAHGLSTHEHAKNGHAHAHGLSTHGLSTHELSTHELSTHEPDEQAIANQSSVVLDIGGDIGALILYTPPELSGAEIEISLPGAGPRTHSIVRERNVGRRRAGRHAAPEAGSGDATVYAAVYPGLTAGLYTIWRDAQTPAGKVQVEGGEVANWLWE
jgi:hypothetical protein